MARSNCWVNVGTLCISNFAKTNIDDRHAPHLANLHGLHQLGLESTAITEAAIAPLWDMPELIVLCVQDCELSDEEVTRIQSRFVNRPVDEEYELAHTDILAQFREGE